jgi:hypothetical protein
MELIFSATFESIRLFFVVLMMSTSKAPALSGFSLTVHLLKLLVQLSIYLSSKSDNITLCGRAVSGEIFQKVKSRKWNAYFRVLDFLHLIFAAVALGEGPVSKNSKLALLAGAVPTIILSIVDALLMFLYCVSRKDTGEAAIAYILLYFSIFCPFLLIGVCCYDTCFEENILEDVCGGAVQPE